MNDNLNPQPVTVTRTMAGHAVTLTAGCWYIAARPMAARGRAAYPITIYAEGWNPILTLDPMTYDDANAFLAEFNNGETSFDGRTW